MNIKVLEDIGLSRGESKVYLALLNLGTTTTGPISKKSGVSASKVYKILDKLSVKGLVSYVLIGKTKNYSASNPESILNIVKEKESKLQKDADEFLKILPELRKEIDFSRSKARVEVYEGYKGLTSVFDEIPGTLKKGETLYTLGIPNLANGPLQRYLVHFYKLLGKNGIKSKAIYNENARATATERKNKYSEFKFMPKGIITPAIISVYKDRTIINIRSEKEQTFLFVIYSKETADSFKQYFNIMWNIAKD
jgi:sugar-specific transcriptional regulator TrmB